MVAWLFWSHYHFPVFLGIFPVDFHVHEKLYFWIRKKAIFQGQMIPFNISLFSSCSKSPRFPIKFSFVKTLLVNKLKNILRKAS